jgi:hypothetical protein
VKVGVWCAVSARRIVVPVVFNKASNCEKYLRVERTVFSTLGCVQRLLVVWKADNGTAFTHSPAFAMFRKIEKPAAFEMRSVIRFLNARNMKPADILQLREVYEKHAISNSMVRRWVRHFIEGRENVYDDPRSGRPSVVNDDLVCAVEEKIQENTIHHFVTFSAFSTNFTVTSRNYV